MKCNLENLGYYLIITALLIVLACALFALFGLAYDGLRISACTNGKVLQGKSFSLARRECK